jgi:hypothetical protein
MVNSRNVFVVGLVMVSVVTAVLFGLYHFFWIEPHNTDRSASSARMVDWYKLHRSDLAADLKRCKGDPGQLGMTPDCLNVTTAQRQIEMQDFRASLADPAPQK